MQHLPEGNPSGFDQHLSRPFETMARGLLAHALPGGRGLVPPRS